jgi:DNA-binding beta-propeller fold protein YncE
VVDDNMQVIYKFTNDGKRLVQTIGTPEVEGADGTHFNRPTFMDWLPDGTFFVSDGYTGTRVAKFDKDGKFLMHWGIKGNPPNETRPGYMNNVHGVAVDPVSRRVFVNDRNNHRIQVFDENGKYLYEWRIDAEPSSLHLFYMGADRNIWTFDRSTHKLLKYDQQGHLLYGWGTLGLFPGSLWGSMESAWIKRGTCTSPRSTGAASRSSGRRQAPTLTSWWPSLCRGSGTSEYREALYPEYRLKLRKP